MLSETIDTPESARWRNSRFSDVRWWLAHVLPPVITFVVVLMICLLAQNSQTAFSPVDEFPHVDAAHKAAHGQILLSQNEFIGSETMRLEACRGFHGDFVPPPCDSPVLDPKEFQEAINTAAAQPSPYYFVTGVAARALVATPLGMDFLDGTRVASAISLALGASLLAGVASRVARSPWLGGALGVVVGTLPSVVAMGATTNPDAWAIGAGTVITALALGRTHFRRPAVYAIILVLAVLTLGLTKPNFAVLMLLPAVIVASRSSLQGWTTRDLRARAAEIWPELTALTVGMFGFAVLSGAPLLFGRAESQAAMSSRLAISEENPWTLTATIDEITRAVVPTNSNLDYVFPLIFRNPMTGFTIAMSGLLAGAVIVGVVSGKLRTRYFALSLAAVVGLLAAPALVLFGQLAAGYFFAYPHRYSFVMVPTMALAVAALPHARPRLIALFATLPVIGYLLVFTGADIVIR